MFKAIKNKFSSLPFVVKNSVIGTGLMVGATSAHADVAGSISNAFTTATTNVESVAVGVIALAAIVTGVGLIIAFLKK
jgi:hypothetical protein